MTRTHEYAWLQLIDQRQPDAGGRVVLYKRPCGERDWRVVLDGNGRVIELHTTVKE